MLEHKHTDRLPPQNALVRKSNAVSEACHDLTMNQLKLMHWLSRAVQEDDSDYKYYDIEVPLFLQFMQLKGSNSARDRIRDVTASLQKKSILIRQPGNPDEWEQFSLLRYSRVFRKNNGLVLRLSVNPEMLPYMRDLKEAFIKTGFYLITEFKSRYGWRLYEWCKQFENTGWFQIELSDMRQRLQIGEDEYTRFNNFRQRVITPALDDINRVSDLSVQLEKTIKRGRSVHALRFTIEKKKEQVIASQGDVPDRKTLVRDCLVSHGMPQAEAQRNIDQFYDMDRDHLLNCLDDLQSKIDSGFVFQKGHLAWLRYILKNDQRKQSTLFVSGSNRPDLNPERTANLKKQQDARNRVAYLEETLVDVKRHHEKARRTLIDEVLTTLSSDLVNAYVADTLPHLEGFTRSVVKPETFWHHPLTRTEVDKFIQTNGTTPLTYDQYCQNVGFDPDAVHKEIDACKEILTSS